MTLNRRSTKWLPKISLFIGLTLLALLAVFKISAQSPEMGVLDSLEVANSLQLAFESIFF